jgi:hypothetical protein
MKFLLLLCTFISSVKICNAQYNILPVKAQAGWVDQMLEHRLDSLLPELMERTGIDFWVIISREYNEDPVMKTMLPSSWISARRRTIMAFYYNKDQKTLEKTAIARYDVGKLLKGDWNIDVFPDQYEALADYIKRCNPEKIGMNTSLHFGLADGLAHTEYELLVNGLPEKFSQRIISAEKLALAWLETRSAPELEVYPEICGIGHKIISECFSADNITPGTTTTDDLVWWLRQKAVNLGLEVWFHPTVSIQRADKENFEHLRSFSKRPEGQIIQYGDLLHVDFGISYLRLNTDQQQHFYILHPDETEVPSSLSAAFVKANKLQDMLTANFVTGRSGNEILKRTLEQARAEGIEGSVYTHPIGFHGHAAGPTIGLWDQQQGVSGQGDYIVYPNTAYSIELNAASEIPEWGKVIRIMLEEDGIFDGKSFRYADGRQTAIFPVKCR